jgi:hypothetical protein
MSMGRRMRACTRLSEVANASTTRDHVRGISGSSTLFNSLHPSSPSYCDHCFPGLNLCACTRFLHAALDTVGTDGQHGACRATIAAHKKQSFADEHRNESHQSVSLAHSPTIYIYGEFHPRYVFSRQYTSNASSVNELVSCHVTCM